MPSTKPSKSRKRAPAVPNLPQVDWEPQDANLSLRTRIGQAVRAMIVSGELRPGQRLLQQQLAKRFGVSQSVLRESLLEAEFTGLVESVDRMGAFVAAIDLRQLMEAYEIREMLEGLAARRCCEHISPADLRELTDMAQTIHSLGLTDKDDQRLRLDRQFHERIIRIAGSRVVERLSEGYHIVRLVVVKEVPHDQVLADHLAILAAIQGNDPDQAERAARKHVASARQMIRRQLATTGISFPWEAREAPSAQGGS